MKASYEDIRSCIDADPLWHDENGVPRYEPFHPSLVPNIYADEAALVLIECQNCGQEFEVGVSHYKHDFHMQSGKTLPRLSESIARGGIGYRDPPNTGCCPSGPTMCSNELRVLEYWTRDNDEREWKRDAAFEIPLADSEAGHE